MVSIYVPLSSQCSYVLLVFILYDIDVFIYHLKLQDAVQNTEPTHAPTSSIQSEENKTHYGEKEGRKMGVYQGKMG